MSYLCEPLCVVVSYSAYLTKIRKPNFWFKLINDSLLVFHKQLLYISTSVWVLRTPNDGRNSHFQRFCCKNRKKARNLQQISAKNSFFLHLHQNAGRLFYSQKMVEIYNTHSWYTLTDSFDIISLLNMWNWISSLIMTCQL